VVNLSEKLQKLYNQEIADQMIGYEPSLYRLYAIMDVIAEIVCQQNYITELFNA